ncbi:MAG: branched-chain amino acid ABC transporter permease [Spirochaetes bacterium]|nr:branched-chain amino acid ABC transporter permease [Spirochaetota bacterium]
MIFSLLIDGLSVGSVYALVAVGLVMLAQSTGTMNFAHGDFMMFSTFVAYALLVQLKFPFALALIGAMVFASLLGFTVERLIIHHLIGGPMAASIMATLGVAYILQGIAKDIWSDNIFRFPETFPGDYIQVGPARMSPQSIGVIASTLIVISLLYLFLNKTKAGTALRALTQNRQAVLLMGVRVSRMFSISWIVGGVLAGVAGVLYSYAIKYLEVGYFSNMGLSFFLILVVGGIGRVYGPLFGSVFLTLLPQLLGGKFSQQMSLVYGIILVVFVLAAPKGFYGLWWRIRRIWASRPRNRGEA